MGREDSWTPRETGRERDNKEEKETDRERNRDNQRERERERDGCPGYGVARLTPEL